MSKQKTNERQNKKTRWVALMIQLEQQQHGEFVGGWGGWVGGGLHQLPIYSSLGLDQYFQHSFQCYFRNIGTYYSLPSNIQYPISSTTYL